jgi:ketosteroid isomerase-like protein
VKEWISAVNSGNLARLLELANPAIEFRSYLASLSGEKGAYRGHDGLRRYLRDLHDAWAWFRVETEEFRDLGDVVLQRGGLRAKGRASGAEVAEQFVFVHRFEEGSGPGRYLGVEPFPNERQALEAVGLSA